MAWLRGEKQCVSYAAQTTLPPVKAVKIVRETSVNDVGG
ncbi:hypothetical protein FB99_47020 (plasmid) [Pantoea agglomerans]|nr:hypothetical protein FB99_47020 [Pantoea agglomerans]